MHLCVGPTYECMHVYTYVYVFYIYARTYANYAFVCVWMHAYIYMYAYVYVWMHIYMHMYVCTECTYVCMYIYIWHKYVCIYMQLCVHTFINTFKNVRILYNIHINIIIHLWDVMAHLLGRQLSTGGSWVRLL